MQEGQIQPPSVPPAFSFTEMLQHHAQTGRTGMFEIGSGPNLVRLYLMTGIVAHAEHAQASGEDAVWEALSQENPLYIWHEDRTPSYMSMSASAQELLLRFIQLQGSGELERIRAQNRSLSVTRNLDDSNMLYIMSFDIQSKEIPPTSFLVQTRQVRVGRHTDNDLVLHDTSVSRKHAILIRNNDAILVRDLGSKNGITINGHPLTQGLLRDQEILTLGEVILRLNVCKTPNSAAHTGSIPSPTAASTV
jgi:hypothetical protein